MNFKKIYFSKPFYLLMLSIIISLLAFSCNESEEVILDDEPKPLLMKFVNASDYDLSGFKMGGKIQLPNLAAGEETEFIKMDIYTYPYSAKIHHKLQDTVGSPPLRCDDGYQSNKIIEGKYTVVLSIEQEYHQKYDEQGVSLGLMPYCLYLISTSTKH